MKKNLLLASALIQLGAGCTLAPKYERPDAPISSNWPSGQIPETVGAASTSVWTDIPWREFYVDEKLRSIIDLALANNRDLRAAALTIEKTRAMYRIQRADLAPSLNVSALGTRQQVFANVETFEKSVQVEYYTINVGFSSYELDLFGRIRSLKARALEQYLATEQARQAMQISLVAEAAAAYLNLAADSERLRIARETVANRETMFALIERRVGVGEASELDVRLARTGLDAARGDAARYTGQVALDKNALGLLVGTAVPPELLPSELGAISAIRDIKAGLPSEVLQRRPDILQAENLLKAANANIGAARAAFFPSISLTGNYGTMDDQLGGLFKAGSWVWGFTPQITLPIFDADRNAARFGAAKADRDIALAQYEKAIQTAFREVADALSRRRSILDQVEAQESLVQAAASARDISDSRYRNGEDDYLSALDAQLRLYGAQQDLIAIRLANLANLVALYKALGGG